MVEIQNYAGFVTAILIFQAVPGPGTIAILNATARNGRGAGLAAVAGTLLGDFLFMLAAIAGLAAVMQGNPVLFRGLQWLGAGYLVWIGIQLLRRRVVDGPAAAEPERTAGAYLRQAAAVSLTNPKVMLFFVSFFPLFLKPGASGLTLAVMVLHVTLLSLLYQAGLVFVGNAVAARLRALPAARRVATRIAGLGLLAFGLKLALDNR
jgi:leucine efflux protein